MLDEIMKTDLVANHVFDHLVDLVKIMEAEWGMALAMFLKNELLLSDDVVDRLRLAIMKRHVNGNWERRVWFKCPITSRTMYAHSMIKPTCPMRPRHALVGPPSYRTANEDPCADC